MDKLNKNELNTGDYIERGVKRGHSSSPCKKRYTSTHYFDTKNSAVNNLLLNYHDPVFSIVLIILIAVAVALMTHGWNLYRREKLKQRLDSFLERFDTASCSLEEENVPYEEGMAKPLLMLARAFEQSGNYDKTVSILLYLIRHSDDDELLIYLGRVYLRAGFLQRAEDIFLEILSRHPRRSDVLMQLELLYEKLHRYAQARDALDALEAQGEETAALRAYLHFLQIQSDREHDRESKRAELERLLEKEPALYRPILQELFRLDTDAAWSRLDPARLDELLDILWFLPPAQLQLDIIAKNSGLHSLFYARGELSEPPETPSGLFAVDLLCAARKSGFEKGDLHFAYLCSECKRSFPVSFVRCPGCMALNTVKVEERLAPQQPRRGDTLF